MKTKTKKSSSAATHLFMDGQTVRLKGPANGAESEVYRITGTLPPKENSPQYRIQNKHEHHERVITQELIELVSATPTNIEEALIENTFGKPAKLAKASMRREVKVPAVWK